MIRGRACPGLLWAGGILLAWLFTLPPLLAIDGAFIERRLLTPLVTGSAAWLPPSIATGVASFLVVLVAALAVLLRSFLHTGLFIVAHDAMHGVLHRGSGRANARLGQLALFLYAGLAYGRCLRQHHRQDDRRNRRDRDLRVARPQDRKGSNPKRKLPERVAEPGCDEIGRAHV